MKTKVDLTQLGYTKLSTLEYTYEDRLTVDNIESGHYDGVMTFSDGRTVEFAFNMEDLGMGRGTTKLNGMSSLSPEEKQEVFDTLNTL